MPEQLVLPGSTQWNSVVMVDVFQQVAAHPESGLKFRWIDAELSARRALSGNAAWLDADLKREIERSLTETEKWHTYTPIFLFSKSGKTDLALPVFVVPHLLGLLKPGLDTCVVATEKECLAVSNGSSYFGTGVLRDFSFTGRAIMGRLVSLAQLENYGAGR